jgi:hypothetical protein
VNPHTRVCDRVICERPYLYSNPFLHFYLPNTRALCTHVATPGLRPCISPGVGLGTPYAWNKFLVCSVLRNGDGPQQCVDGGIIQPWSSYKGNISVNCNRRADDFMCADPNEFNCLNEGKTSEHRNDLDEDEMEFYGYRSLRVIKFTTIFTRMVTKCHYI